MSQVAYHNAFALLDDDVPDVTDVAKAAAAATKTQHAKTLASKSQAAATPSASKSQQSSRSNSNNSQQQKEQRSSNAASSGNGDRYPNNRSFEGRRDDRANSNRGRRGGGNSGASGARGGANRPSKHEYERRSGSDRTTIKGEEKRGGGGRGNWGSPVEAPETAETSNKESGEEGEATDEDANATPAVEEPKEMTLAEYRNAEASKRTVSDFAIRSVEGPSKGQMGYGAQQYDQSVGANEVFIKIDKSNSSKKNVAPKLRKEKQVVTIDVAPYQRPRNEREERGNGGRQQRGRGGRNGGSTQREQVPKFDATSDFPSLK